MGLGDGLKKALNKGFTATSVQGICCDTIHSPAKSPSRLKNKETKMCAFFSVTLAIQSRSSYFQAQRLLGESSVTAELGSVPGNFFAKILGRAGHQEPDL